MFSRVGDIIVIGTPEEGYTISIAVGDLVSYPIYAFEGLNDIPDIAEDFSDFIFLICGQIPFYNEIPLASFWEQARKDALEKLNKPGDFCGEVK